MQPQGLEALMPQGAAGPQPQAPQMGGPRLAAAMDLVTSDAEEQVIDPRTLAMLKYKDALDAMQAADRMMAAAQPQPMPPTVAERTKMAAEQGIAGLASRLSPGIQQRGNQLASQELRQAVGGGLPQLPAPNMARMAGGGIVAFQDGGDVEISDEMRRAYAGYGFTDEQIKEALRRSAGADRALEPAVEYAVENPVESAAMALMGGPAAVAGRAGLGALLSRLGSTVPSKLGKGAQALVTKPNPNIVRGEGFTMRSPEMPQRVFSPLRAGASTLVGKEAFDYLMADGGEEPSAETAEQAAAPAAAEQAAQQQQQPGGLAALVEQMRSQGDAPVGRTASDTGRADDLESLRESTSFILDRALRPDFAESSGRNVEERAREAYGVPEELKELYRSRIEALDKPMFTPEEERSRKISAILSGLASSNLIAQGGPAASRAVAEVSDAIRADSVARAEKQFDLASGLLGMDMQASQRAFNAGLEATITAMNQQGVALQMAISQLTAAADREAAALLQESRNGIEMTKQMIEAFKNGQSNAIDVQRNVGAMVRDLGDRIDKLKTSGLPGQPLSPEVNTAIRVLENERSALQSVFNAALGESGFAVPEISGGVGLTPDDEELIKRYTR
jgi:hypothetical protein